MHFDFDNDQIKSSEIIKLENNIKWLNDNPWAYIVLEGHCDIVGSEDYNIYLGDRRARSVKAYLYEHGIDPERIVMLVSYGKSRPIDLAKGLKANSQNRRVEFVLR
ncbi:OmpA family protein [bacterium]|nr:OmpA family protein [bacterium]